MHPNLGVIAVAVIALAIGGWLWWHRDAPRTCTALFLVAGIGIASIVGTLIAGALTKAGAPAEAPGSAAGKYVFIVIVGASVLAAIEVVGKGIGWGRHLPAKPRRWHPWAALVLPTVAIAAGVPVLAQIFGAFAGGFGHAGGALMQLGQR